jgi:hypothetical protein
MWTGVHIMCPVGMGGVACGAVMILAPSKVGNLRCVNRTTAEYVAEGEVSRICGCATTNTGLEVEAVVEPLKERVPLGSLLP